MPVAGTHTLTMIMIYCDRVIDRGDFGSGFPLDLCVSDHIMSAFAQIDAEQARAGAGRRLLQFEPSYFVVFSIGPRSL